MTEDKTIKIAIHGAMGRMGKAVIRSVVDHGKAELVAAIERDSHPQVGTDAGVVVGVSALGVSVSSSIREGLQDADVVIDFSLAEPSTALLRAAAEAKVPVVVGTTGGDESWESALGAASSVCPVVAAANFSPGVTALLSLAEQAVKLLGEGFDAEIVEMHHRDKVDSPSGTARRLAETVSSAKGLDEEAWVHGREGLVGKRGVDEIGVLSLRGGGVVGDHTLVLASGQESVEITHRAFTRDVFASGALRAAFWVQGQPPGRYGMTDVLRG